MLTIPSVPAYSFGRLKKKERRSHTPGPGKYDWFTSKDKTLKNEKRMVFGRARKDRKLRKVWNEQR